MSIFHTEKKTDTAAKAVNQQHESNEGKSFPAVPVFQKKGMDEEEPKQMKQDPVQQVTAEEEKPL